MQAVNCFEVVLTNRNDESKFGNWSLNGNLSLVIVEMDRHPTLIFIAPESIVYPCRDFMRNYLELSAHNDNKMWTNF